jgi:hypothetical protein
MKAFLIRGSSAFNYTLDPRPSTLCTKKGRDS